MKISILSSVLTLVVIVSSCNFSSKKESQIVVTLTEEDLPEIEYLRLEKVDLPCELPFCSMVYKDTLVISYTNYPSPYFISVYGLNSKKLLGECYKQGRGPGEMNDCGLVIKNSQVFAYEPGNAVSEMDIDKLISLGGDYEPVVVHIPSSFRKSFAVYDDSILVGSNDFYLDGYERSKDIPALLKIDLRTGMLIPDEDMRDLDFFAGPVSGGQVVNFKESNQIMLALLKRPCMKIFDRDLNLVKTIVGPDKDDIEFAENVMDGFAFIEEKENETSAFFIDSYATGNEIFVLNDRAYKCTYKSMINEVAKSQEVWVFDMKGDIKRRYKIENPESVIYSISYSAATQTLYANSYDEDGETIFCRCVPVE